MDMEIAERVKVVSELQKQSVNVFKEVSQSLRVGMSEQDIAALIKAKYEKRGIIDFWYDVPIIVLIGVERFLDAANADYTTKSPSASHVLNEGDMLYVDLHPRDSKTGLWGDWDTMAIFQPRKGIDDEQVAFLEEIREIHRDGIAKLTPNMTGADVVNYYLEEYKKRGINLIIGEKPDVGHTIHEGKKTDTKRLLLTAENTTPISGYVYAIEPGGARQKKSGARVVVGRFEESVYIPKDSPAIILGSQELLPMTI